MSEPIVSVLAPATPELCVRFPVPVSEPTDKSVLAMFKVPKEIFKVLLMVLAAFKVTPFVLLIITPPVPLNVAGNSILEVV